MNALETQAIIRVMVSVNSDCSNTSFVSVIMVDEIHYIFPQDPDLINPYPTAFPYGNGMVLHFYQQQESSTTKTVHKVINKGLKTYV